MAGMDIESGLSAFFEQDHRDCDARWADVEELLDTQDVDAAGPAWQKFDKGMRRHIAMEEEVVFPAFEAAARMGGGDENGCRRLASSAVFHHPSVVCPSVVVSRRR